MRAFLVALAWSAVSIQAPVEVDFAYSACLAFVNVKVNGQEMLFLVDTGANRTAIDPVALKQIGVTLDSVSVGTATAQCLVVTTLDLSGYIRPDGQRVSGILGFDFLRKFAVGIDFQKKKLSFGAPATGSGAMIALPFRLDNGVPRFSATLNDGIAADFRLDTGASLFPTKEVYVNVISDVWDKLRSADPHLAPETSFTGSGIGGEVQLPVARVKKMTLGELVLASPFVIVQPRQGYFANKDAAGLISNNLLEKFSPVVIDYPAKKLYLTRKP